MCYILPIHREGVRSKINIKPGDLHHFHDLFFHSFMVPNIIMANVTKPKGPVKCYLITFLVTFVNLTSLLHFLRFTAEEVGDFSPGGQPACLLVDQERDEKRESLGYKPPVVVVAAQ